MVVVVGRGLLCPLSIVKVCVCVLVSLKYACVYIESVIHSLPQVLQGGQRDRVT